MADTITLASREHTARDSDRLPIDENKINVGQVERWASLLAGGYLLVKGLQKGGLVGLTMAGTAAGMLYRGTTGHCHIYDTLHVNTATTDTMGVHVEEVVTINRPADELFRFWRNFENLPRFMHHLENVEVITDKVSRWTVKAPAGFTVSWDAEIVSETENSGILWRSLEDAQITNAGSVRFLPAPDGRGTEVRVSLSYNPPAGSVGVAVAKLFGEEPAQQITKDLRRFKQLMEAGEIPTTQGQPSGASVKRRLKSGLLPSAISAQNGKEPGTIEPDLFDHTRRWMDESESSATAGS